MIVCTFIQPVGFSYASLIAPLSGNGLWTIPRQLLFINKKTILNIWDVDLAERLQAESLVAAKATGDAVQAVATG
jgi:hypothetical protein